MTAASPRRRIAAEALAGAIERSKLRYVDAGHFLTIEQSEAVAEAILEFASRVDLDKPRPGQP